MEDVPVPTAPVVPPAPAEKPKPAEPVMEPPSTSATSPPVVEQTTPAPPAPQADVPTTTPAPPATPTLVASAAPAVNADIVQQIQPYAVVAGILLAVVYGLGYLAQYQANLALGIGPVYPNKETAVGTGIGCLLHIAMGTWLGYRYAIYLDDIARGEIIKLNTGWKHVCAGLLRSLGLVALVVLTSLIIEAFLLGGTVPPSNWRPNYWLLPIGYIQHAGSVLVIGATSFAAIHQMRRVRESSSRLVHILPGVAWMLTICIIPNLLGSSLGADVAHRQPLFGGYCVTPVSFWSETDKSEKRGLLLVSSQDYAVVARFDTREQFWAAFEKRNDRPLPLYKLRLDKVNYFSSGDAPIAATMPTPASTATPTPTSSPSATPTPAVKPTPATIPLARK